MFRVVFIVCFFFLQSAFSQESKQEYLSRNKFDLNKLSEFPQSDIKIIGFGAYHGSAKNRGGRAFAATGCFEK